VRFSRKPVPVAGKREEIVDNSVWSLPDGAVVWEKLRLSPFDLHIKKRGDGGDAAAAKGVVEAAHGINRYGHESLRLCGDIDAISREG